METEFLGMCDIDDDATFLLSELKAAMSQSGVLAGEVGMGEFVFQEFHNTDRDG